MVTFAEKCQNMCVLPNLIYRASHEASSCMFAMLSMRFTTATAVCVALGTLHCTTARITLAQTQNAGVNQETALIIDGSVKGVFQNGDERLIQILVQRSEVPGPIQAGMTRYPAPGEYVYVHVDVQRSLGGRIAGRAGASTVPQPQSRIRAFLTQGELGQWEAAGQDWYQESPEQLVDRSGRSTSDQSIDSLGVSSERISLNREVALKVMRVTADSPAAKAGIEPGDILVKANGAELTSQEQLNTAFLLSRGNLAITVRDVRTGKDVLVDVKSDRALSIPGASAPSLKPLGVKTELAFYNGEAALKVTSVEPDSPARQAGIVSGLLILTANGKPLTKPEQLTEAERQSRGRLQLQLVDPNTRREQVVQVAL